MPGQDAELEAEAVLRDAEAVIEAGARREADLQRAVWQRDKEIKELKAGQERALSWAPRETVAELMRPLEAEA